MIKYKKVLNNKNAIEIDNKIVLSFDSRYKEYLKWRDENPDLEQQLVVELEQEIENKRLYNDGSPHIENSINKWYSKDGDLILESETLPDGSSTEKLYYKNGIVSGQTQYKNGEKTGKYTQWDEDGKKTVEGFNLHTNFCCHGQWKGIRSHHRLPWRGLFLADSQ